MAIEERAIFESWVAATTFSSTNIGKFVVAVVSTAGEAQVIDPASSNVLPVGVLASYTQTTTTDVEAVRVAVAGAVKIQALASTMHAGNFFAASSAGYAIAPTTDNLICGVVKYGTSGGTGRLLTGTLWQFGPAAV